MLFTWNGEHLYGDFFVVDLETGFLCVALAIYPGTHSVDHAGL